MARRFGLVFTHDEQVTGLQKSTFGLDVAARNGNETVELPVPGRL